MLSARLGPIVDLFEPILPGKVSNKAARRGVPDGFALGRFDSWGLLPGVKVLSN